VHCLNAATTATMWLFLVAVLLYTTESTARASCGLQQASSGEDAFGVSRASFCRRRFISLLVLLANGA